MGDNFVYMVFCVHFYVKLLVQSELTTSVRSAHNFVGWTYGTFFLFPPSANLASRGSTHPKVDNIKRLKLVHTHKEHFKINNEIKS